MKKIFLTGKLGNGEFALVDDDVYAALNTHKWHMHKDGYAFRSGSRPVTQKSYTILMHRVITNAPKGMEVDHKNHNNLDNRKENLRVCTRSQNCMNRKKSTTSKGRFKGVYWEKNRRKWTVYLYMRSNEKWLGYFDNEEDAARAYNKAAIELYGEFALINRV